MYDRASFYNHPIYTGFYIVPTLAIDETLEWMLYLVDNRIPGGIISSKPRFGKSRACKYAQVRRLGASDENRFLIYLFVCTFETRPNENVFYEALLDAINYDIITGRSARDKRERLVGFLKQEAKLNSTNRIVLIVDEAQKLLYPHYQWLMDIHNHLDAEGIALTVILVGQDELHHMRTVFVQTKKTQIVGRFMVYEKDFSGIRDKEDMRICLQSYDEISKYPVNDGPTYTQFFFPEKYERGFRLSFASEELFNIYQDIRKQNHKKIEEKKDIPMQYVTLAVEYYLKTFGIYGENTSEMLGKAHWNDAVKSSGFANAEILSTVKRKST